MHLRREGSLLVVWLACVFALAILPAQAGAPSQNPTTGGAVDANANYVTIAVIAHITGDANNNGSATVQYRQQGAPSWTQGHPLYRLDSTRYAGSIFWLSAATTYEVDVQLSDPDGVSNDPAPFLITTRSETIPGQGTGRQIYVSPTGNDNGQGTQQDPYRTIGKAHSVSLPGDYIHVLPGIYRESLTLTRSGSASAYITYKAEGSGVILESSAPQFKDATPDWTQYSGNVYQTNYTPTTTYVAADGLRLYRRGNLSSLVNNADGVDGGFYKAKKVLYVSIPGNGGDPDNHTMDVATLEHGMRLDPASYIVIDGFEIRYYGITDYQKGIMIAQGNWNVIRNCTVRNCGDGVWLRGSTTTANNLVTNNTVYENGPTSWPWEAVKGTEMEESGIYVEAGWGNVIRNNVVHGFFNAIAPTGYASLTDENYNGNCDVYGNVIYDITDDAIETEGAALNVKAFDNDISYTHMGLNIAPITKGPVYYIRNVVYQWADTPTQAASALKLSNGSAGRVYVYHNTFCTTAADQNGINPPGDWENVQLRNNILYASWYAIEDMYDGGAPNSLWDYDDIFTTYYNPSDPRYVKWANVRYPTLADWQAATGQEPHGIAQDPLFTNMSTGDLTLQTGSPCINAGVYLPGINAGYLGSAPDMGAYEKQ